MKIRPGRIKIKSNGAELFYCFNFSSIISTYVFRLRAGLISSIIVFISFLFHRKYWTCFKHKPFALFFLISCLSGIAYLHNGRPFVLFLQALSYNAIPMLLYGVGAAAIDSEKSNRFYKSVVINNMIMITIGLAIYMIPSLAAQLGSYSYVTAGIDKSGVGYRFSSYLGSLELGSITAINLVLLLFVNFKKKAIKLLSILFTCVALFLTLQRGAWIIGTLGVCGCMAISVFVEKSKSIGKTIAFIPIIILSTITLSYFIEHYLSPGMMTHLSIRIRDFNTADMFDGRTEDYVLAIKTFLKYPFGLGIGAAGNKASAYALAIVPDGNYFRVLVESGLFGFAAFVWMNVKTLVVGMKRKEYYSVLIIVLFLLHAVGSNVFDFYYASFVYWYVLGFINRGTKTVPLSVVRHKTTLI